MTTATTSSENENNEIRATLLRALQDIAPETDAASALSGGADLREALDIDSMDFLRFVVSLHERLGVEIPEKDYGRIRTLDACVDYVADAKRNANTETPSP
jgi:acyl carrier protein